jgi:hypothetical protein
MAIGRGASLLAIGKQSSEMMLITWRGEKFETHTEMKFAAECMANRLS